MHCRFYTSLTYMHVTNKSSWILNLKVRWRGGGERSIQQVQTPAVHHRLYILNKTALHQTSWEKEEQIIGCLNDWSWIPRSGPRCAVLHWATLQSWQRIHCLTVWPQRRSGPLITSLEADLILMYWYRFHKPVFPQRGLGQWATQHRPYQRMLCHCNSWPAISTQRIFCC